MPKFIFIAGGVISGLGKGIVTSSIGKMFQKRGYKVTAVKIDPYINIDAGTMRPTEHGEVWVTDDGGEIDQDFGHYERFLDIAIPKKNNITTGQIYYSVIKRERKGEYLGKTVQYIPHIRDEVVRRIKECAQGYDICVVEIGGTIGDNENEIFILAANTFSKRDSVFVLVTYLPTPTHIGEMKSKPAQHAIKWVNMLGVQPDYIIARSNEEIDGPRREKISLYSGIDSKRIIPDQNVDLIYRVPMVFEKNEFADMLCDDLGLEKRNKDWSSWKNLLEKPEKEITIAMVCKYIDIGKSILTDSYVSVNEALGHAGIHLKTKVNIKWIDAKLLETGEIKPEELSKYNGILVPGGFGTSGIEGKILAIKYARENKIPYLGLCLGMQLAVVEFARNICGMNGANSTEINSTTQYPVIDILPEQKELLKESKYGATMRLGSYPAVLKNGTLISRLYNDTLVKERHRHRYEVNPQYIETLERSGLIFSGASPDRKLMEFLELQNHPFFIATQAHPEFTSRFEKPNPLFLGFVKACLNKNP